MKWRTFAIGITALAVAATLPVGTAALGSGSAESAGGSVTTTRTDAKPNFVIIQTDDQTVEDLSVMKHTKRLLQDQGTTFTQMMTPFAICCPSRAAMMSACYPHNNKVNANFPPNGGFKIWERVNGERFVGSWMQDAGYHTAHIGKYINGYGYINNANAGAPKGWSEWHGSTDPSTYQMWGYRLNQPTGSKVYGKFPIENPKNYGTTVYSNIAQESITEQAKADNPFYLQVAFLAPHIETKPLKRSAMKKIGQEWLDVDDPNKSSGIQSIPPRPAPRDKNKLKGEQLDRDPSFNEQNVEDKQEYIRNLPLLDKKAIRELRQDNRQRRQSLLSVDRAIRDIVNTLTETGEIDNTYIVMVGDNGYLLGEHRIPKGKYFPYEPALNIPFIVRGPGVQQGATFEQLVMLIDIVPTVLDFAGVSATGREPDGISLRGALESGAVIPNRTLLLSSGPQQAPNGTSLPLFDGVRTARYAYWKYDDGFEEMYDLAKDPYQMQSVAYDDAYAATKQALIAEWETLKTCSGATCQVVTRAIPDPVN